MPMIRICPKPGVSPDASGFRAFAEDVVAEFRNDFRVSVSDAEVSVALDRVEVETRANQIRRSVARIEPILRRHRLAEVCEIVTEV